MVSKRVSLIIARGALLLSVLAYIYSLVLAYGADILTFTNPAIPMAWLKLARETGFWSIIAICLSAIACVVTQIAYMCGKKPSN
jgi:hypothetical protein